MFDGFYQSLICFFMPYLLYEPANFATANGLNINDRTRMGVLVASAAVIASNTYIMLNTYRWDWLTVLINAISSLLIFLWTGIYSSVPASAQFYKSAAEVYGALSFWVVLLLTVTICLLPRFAIKAVQKVFFPYDVDIIREQTTLGKFDYLKDFQELPSHPAATAGVGDESATSSDVGKPVQPTMKQDPMSTDEDGPFYASSMAPTTNRHNARSQNGSNGTNYSFDTMQRPHPQTVDYVRHSADRTRHSFDRDQPSFGATNDFTSPNRLSRIETSNSNMHVPQSPPQSLHSPLKGPYDPPTHAV